MATTTEGKERERDGGREGYGAMAVEALVAIWDCLQKHTLVVLLQPRQHLAGEAQTTERDGPGRAGGSTQ